jgi:DNA adenine methylase
METFLKWPGSKRWLAPLIEPLLVNLEFGRWVEPFAGSASLFFHFEPGRAILSDVNSDLISTYRTVSHRPHSIARALGELPVSKRFYYRERAREPQGAFDRAVRFLYLNRTCFRGIYRVNKDGRFNVPYGGGERDATILHATPILSEAAKLLRKAELKVADFETTIASAKAGDFIYCDPIYPAIRKGESFSRYNCTFFGWDDQRRLAAACAKASKRGCNILISNAMSPGIRELYKHAVILSAFRDNPLGKLRGASSYHESLIFLGKELTVSAGNAQSTLLKAA